LVELGPDAVPAVVQRPQRHARHLQHDQPDDQQGKANGLPCVGVLKEVHLVYPTLASACSTSAASAAWPVSRSMIAAAVSAAMPRTCPIAALRAAAIRASASAISWPTRASSSA